MNTIQLKKRALAALKRRRESLASDYRLDMAQLSHDKDHPDRERIQRRLKRKAAMLAEVNEGIKALNVWLTRADGFNASCEQRRRDRQAQVA